MCKTGVHLCLCVFVMLNSHLTLMRPISTADNCPNHFIDFVSPARPNIISEFAACVCVRAANENPTV